MRFHTRKQVKPEDLNPNGPLFGEKLLAWIDEELALYTPDYHQNNDGNPHYFYKNEFPIFESI